MREFGRPESNGHNAAGWPDRTNGAPGGRAARRRAEEAEEKVGPSTAPWSPRTNGFAGESAPMPLSPLPDSRPKPPGRASAPQEPQQRESPRDGLGDRGLPAWSARRRGNSTPPHNDAPPEPDSVPTAAWSLASQDQQLVSGRTVAGDLLRDGVERAARSGRGRSKRDSVLDLDESKTDVYEPVQMDIDHDDIDDEDDEDDDIVDEPSTARSIAAKLAARGSRPTRRSEDDANRRQWLILGGQSAGAAVAGMLLFKGFERMWEMLPWVALALAMIVILGLVALVRILRRTDDILSTVIAVVVGIFVTLGPLAFLLSTN